MPLTNTSIKNAKPKEKSYKLFDSRGLYLEVAPSGGKWWRLKYRFNGKEKRLSLGVYPEISLKDARDRREDARRLIANGVDPSVHRKAARTANVARSQNSFEMVAREWFTKYQPTWVPSHSSRIIQRLERDIFPWLGREPISDIKPPQLLEVIRRIEERGAIETAHRALSNCGQIFRYAVATGRAERDPSNDLKGAIPPVKAKHFAAVTDPKQVSDLLRAIHGYRGSPVVTAALKIAPLVFVRPGELRTAKWDDVCFEKAEWRFVASKTQTDHVVPLARQSIQILRDIEPITGSGPYVFPSARSADRPMSNNAILAALRRMEINKDEMTGHGFRAIARTLLDEVLGFRPEYIEQQLAHAVRDTHGRAYNRTAHLEERKKMMQAWADYLDKLKECPDD